jgi:hypothetical protein
MTSEKLKKRRIAMNTLRTVVITVVCVLFVGVAVEAADLYTPPLFVDNGQLVACEIVNVSGTIRTVQWEIINSSGDDIGGGGPIDIGPGQISGGGGGGTSIYGLYYCHFIVQGNKGQFRAAIKLRNLDPAPAIGTSGDLVALTAD